MEQDIFNGTVICFVLTGGVLVLTLLDFFRSRHESAIRKEINMLHDMGRHLEKEILRTKVQLACTQKVLGISTEIVQEVGTKKDLTLRCRTTQERDPNLSPDNDDVIN